VSLVILNWIDMNHGIGDGTSEQQRKQNILFVATMDFIAQNLFCTGIGPRIAV
jgi:hypothetical protein